MLMITNVMKKGEEVMGERKPVGRIREKLRTKKTANVYGKHKKEQ